DRIELLSTLVPDLRLLVVARDPVERDASELRRRVGSAMRVDGIDLLGRSVDDIRRYIQRIGFVHVTPSLPGELDRWLRCFEREQLLVVLHDDIVERPTEVLAKAYAHLGVEPFEPPAELIELAVNANPSLPVPPEL